MSPLLWDQRCLPLSALDISSVQSGAGASARGEAGPAVTAAPEAMGNHVLVMGDRGWVWPLAVTDSGEPCTEERQMGLCQKTLLAGVARQCHRHGLAVVLGSLAHHGLVFSTVTCSLSVATFLVLGAALSCPTAPVLGEGREWSCHVPSRGGPCSAGFWVPPLLAADLSQGLAWAGLCGHVLGTEQEGPAGPVGLERNLVLCPGGHRLHTRTHVHSASAPG